jgi:hypothetical protein
MFKRNRLRKSEDIHDKFAIETQEKILDNINAAIETLIRNEKRLSIDDYYVIGRTLDAFRQSVKSIDPIGADEWFNLLLFKMT